MSIAERLRTLRVTAGVTQKELAFDTGISLQSIINYENGRREPNSKAMAALERYFNVSGEYLRGEDKSTLPLKKESAAPDISEEALKIAKIYDSLDDEWRTIFHLIADKACTHLKEGTIRYVVPVLRLSPEPMTPAPVRYVTSHYRQPMSAGTGTEAGDDGPEDLMLAKQPPRGTSYVAPVSGDSMEPTFRDGDELFVHACDEVEPGRIGVFLMGGKQWVKELGDGVLISHNPAYQPIPITPDIRCQGLVLGVCDSSYFG